MNHPKLKVEIIVLHLYTEVKAAEDSILTKAPILEAWSQPSQQSGLLWQYQEFKLFQQYEDQECYFRPTEIQLKCIYPTPSPFSMASILSLTKGDIDICNLIKIQLIKTQ